MSADDSRPRTQRQRSIVRPEIHNAGEEKARERREAVEHAFRVVVSLYVDAIEHSDPVGYSSLALLDDSLRCAKRRDVADTLVDVETAVQRALDNDAGLTTKFYRWFVAPEIEPNIDHPLLSGNDAALHDRIVQACGREFRRRGIYPLWKYFGVPPREQVPGPETEP